MDSDLNRSVVFDDEVQYSAEYIEQKSSQLASYLVVNHGVKRGDRILVLAEKSIDIVVVALGIWKSGAIYVPVDVASPVERVRYFINNVDPSVVISSEKVLSDNKAIIDLPVISYEDLSHIDGNKYIDSDIGVDDLGVIIHTSGSTGTPKGVCLSHGSVLAYFTAHNEHLGFVKGDCSVNNGAFHFDVSIQDTFLPIYFGASVYIYKGLYIPGLYARSILKHGVTHLIAISSVLRLITKEKSSIDPLINSNLRVLMTGGESCDVKLINLWRDTFPKLKLLYGYGPTECNSLCVIHEIERSKNNLVGYYPIGRAFSGMSTLLIDRCNNVISQKELSGELVVGGVQLMSGYWNDQAKTEEVFLDIDGKKYYKTGDFCHYGFDGLLYFDGRRDSEVKIRGRRINLNEIAYSALQISGVSHSVVDVVGDNMDIACACLVDEGSEEKISQLRQEFEKRLPNYMRPRYVFVSTSFDKTSSGKISEKLVREKMSNTIESGANKRDVVFS